MGHVADGVDVDQPADTGDQQDGEDRKLVDEQSDVDLPDAAGDQLYSSTDTAQAAASRPSN